MRLLRNLAFLFLVTVCGLFAGQNRMYASYAYCDWVGDNRMVYFDTGPAGLCESQQNADTGVEDCNSSGPGGGFCEDLCRGAGCGFEDSQLPGSCDDYQGACGWEVEGACMCIPGAGH